MSPSNNTIADLTSPPRKSAEVPSRPIVARARVTKPPASSIDSLEVVVPNFSQDHAYTINAEQWYQGQVLPVAGDECVVVFDDDGDIWVSSWRTAAADVVDQRDIDLAAMARRMESPLLTGGGILSADGSLWISWSTRFIPISAGKGPDLPTSGYFNIEMPPNGTVIPGVGSTPNTTVTGGKIPWSLDWEALYYILPLGQDYSSRPENFRMAQYSGTNFDVPWNWILIAIRNDDGGPFVKFATGHMLRPGESTHASRLVPDASIDNAKIAAAAAIDWSKLSTPTGDLGGSSAAVKVDGELGARIDLDTPFTQAGGLMTDPVDVPGASVSGAQRMKRRYLRSINNPVGGTGHKRLRLFWINRDAANWQTGAPIIVEVFTSYYSGGGYTRSVVSGGYNDSLQLQVVEVSGAQPYRPLMSTPTTYATNFTEAEIYVDIADYAQILVCVTYGHRNEVSRPFSTTAGQMAWDPTFTIAGSGGDSSKAFLTDAQIVAANKDGAVGTPSMRTLGSGAQQAAPGNDARFWTTGDVKWSASKTADHTGWLLADGRAITTGMGFTQLRADLVAAGNPHGVSGSDPKLPDLRGRGVVGAGTGSGLTARTFGQILGEENHVLSVSEMPTHNHGGTTGGANVVSGPGGGTIGLLFGGVAAGSDHTHTIPFQGGGGSHNNMQPSVALHPFIKT